MVVALISHGIAFVAGGVFALLFARRNKNKVGEFYQAVDEAKRVFPK